jgi:hypothetical protein
VRAIFYTPEVGFLAIARSCEALENGVSFTWISSTSALASNRSGSSSVCEISSSRQGLFSISTDFFVENLPADLTLENGRRVAHQVSTARLRTRLSGFQLILWRRMTTTCRARVEHESSCVWRNFLLLPVVRRCSPRSPSWWRLRRTLQQGGPRSSLRAPNTLRNAWRAYQGHDNGTSSVTIKTCA